MAKNIGTLKKSTTPRNGDGTFQNEKKCSRASGSRVSSRKLSKKKRNDKERLVDRFPNMESESANLERRRNDVINFLRSRESASLGFVRQYRKSLEKSASANSNGNDGDTECSDSRKRKSNKSMVIEKINAYEQNARYGPAEDTNLNMTNEKSKKTRKLGVPLVGMQATSKISIQTMPKQSSTKSSSANHMYSQYRTTKSQSKLETLDIPRYKMERRLAEKGRSSRRSGRSPSGSRRTLREPSRRPSFKVSKMKTVPANRSFYNGLGRDSVRRSIKRTTLYAKDDGNEAVRVLTNLCLNPLARSRGSACMMW